MENCLIYVPTVGTRQIHYVIRGYYYRDYFIKRNFRCGILSIIDIRGGIHFSVSLKLTALEYLDIDNVYCLIDKLLICVECDMITLNVVNLNSYRDILMDQTFLYSYQKHDLDWMRLVEENVDNGLYIASRRAKGYIAVSYRSNEFVFDKNSICSDLKVYGGCYINQVGLGKSLVILTLIVCTLNQVKRSDYEDILDICNYKYKRGVQMKKYCNNSVVNGSLFCRKHSKNLFSECRRYIRRGSKVIDFYINETSEFIESNATIIMCPSHLCYQWSTEYRKFFDINQARILILITMENVNNLTVEEIGGADIIIMSYSLVLKLELNTLPKHVRPTWNTSYVNFGWFWFKRIVYDEYHEALLFTSGQRERLKSFNAHYIWNVSGTPFPKMYESYMWSLDLLTRVDAQPYLHFLDKELIRFLFRKNTKESVNVEIDGIKVTEIIKWLEFSRAERNLYSSYMAENIGSVKRKLLQLCCHPDLMEKTFSLLKECVTLEEVSNKLLNHNMIELGVLKDRVEEYTSQLYINLDKDVLANVRRRLTDAKTKYMAKERLVNYLEMSIQNLYRDKDGECSICLSEYDSKIVILNCGHIFCKECYRLAAEQNKRCPICKQTSTNSVVYLDKSNLDLGCKKPLSKLDELVDRLRSTKIANIIWYIKESLKENDKCIIFSQWDYLLHKMGELLLENGIKCVFCEGTVFQRTRNIQIFIKDYSTRVILLSSKNAASGINLVEANKVILIEPVYGNKEYKENIEDQAIGRVNRIGQKNDVEVARFLIKDTVEEDIHMGRLYINLNEVDE